MNKTVGHASLHLHTPPARIDVAADQLVQISIVIPLYNEQENVAPLYIKLTEVMDALGEPYELVFVDDGSRTNASLAVSNGHLLLRSDRNLYCIGNR